MHTNMCKKTSVQVYYGVKQLLSRSKWLYLTVKRQGHAWINWFVWRCCLGLWWNGKNWWGTNWSRAHTSRLQLPNSPQTRCLLAKTMKTFRSKWWWQPTCQTRLWEVSTTDRFNVYLTMALFWPFSVDRWTLPFPIPLFSRRSMLWCLWHCAWSACLPQPPQHFPSSGESKLLVMADMPTNPFDQSLLPHPYYRALPM